MIICFVFSPHLCKIKQEDHIPSMPIVGLVVFLARACKHKTSKIGMTIFALPQLKICILQDGNTYKSTYLPQFNSPRKIPQTVVQYFYQIVYFMMNPTKFGSLNLDIPSSSYEFLKFATKSRKINKEKIQNPD